MSIRPDERAQLRDLLSATMDVNDGHVPTSVRRAAIQTFGISKRQITREIAAVRAARTADSGPDSDADLLEEITPDPRRWWNHEDSYDEVLTALASNSIKKAWVSLLSGGTIACSYEQFTRHLHQRITPAVRAALTVDGREAYLENSIYCTTTVPGRNTRWQADAQEIPVWVRPDNGGAAFKPWQVTFIDEATRVIVGTVITETRPSAFDVVAALAAAVRGRTAPDGTFIGGIPRTVRWDNGGEFLNEGVTTACGRFGIGPRPASPYAGWHKGKIERWHLTSQQEMYAALPGYADGPRSFRGRQPFRGEDADLLTFSSLVLRGLAWVDEYNYDRTHTALGPQTTPLDAWRTDPAPLRFATPAMIRPLMIALPRRRKVAKDGISYGGQKFQSPNLRNYKGKYVDIRVLPHDYDTITVFDGDTFVADAARAENMSPEETRELVRHRRADYTQIKAATGRAAARRAQEALVREHTSPTEQATSAPPTSGAVIADDDALLAMFGDEPTADPTDEEKPA